MCRHAELTIIIPVYNRRHIVAKTLASIVAQTLRPLNVIFVDNNSTDGSLQLLEEWKRQAETPDFKVTVLTETRSGAAAARNRGLDETDTEFVMFFDSDDTMAPDHAHRALGALKSPEAPDIVGWDINMHLLDDTIARKPFYSYDALWHCVMHGSMGTQRWASKTGLVRKAGCWDPSILGWDDIELGARMLLLSPRIMRLDGPVTVDVFSQEISITGTDFASGAHKWEKSLDAIERSMPDRRRKRYVNLRRALLAGDYAREGDQAASDRLLSSALAQEPCPFYRALLRFARTYVAAGHRGCARLLRPLF